MTHFKKTLLTLGLLAAVPSAQAASDNGVSVNTAQYAGRAVLDDFTAKPCPTTGRSLTQIKGNLYRHTSGDGASLHSGLVLITKEGALVIDPAMTCTAGWLRDEIKKRFGVKVKYVVYTHAHADHISGSQIFKADGATIVANQRAIEPIVGEKLPVPVPDRVFDKRMTITLGGEKVELYRIAPSHSDSMIQVVFPGYKAMQCTDICQSKTMPYNDFLDFYYNGWIESLDWVIAQNVDIIDVGHYTPATRADQVALRRYMVDLHQQVLNLLRAGQSWDQLSVPDKLSFIRSWRGKRRI
ncbi:MAG: MBL fold metallo-hydrolase, partial [Deinococcus sp.]|nr:MBL fold metallo-hydrolase [Deinococcus sp.]